MRNPEVTGLRAAVTTMWWETDEHPNRRHGVRLKLDLMRAGGEWRVLRVLDQIQT